MGATVAELVGGVVATDAERVNPEVILDGEEDAAEDVVDTVTGGVATKRLSSMRRLWHSWAFWLYWTSCEKISTDLCQEVRITNLPKKTSGPIILEIHKS